MEPFAGFCGFIKGSSVLMNGIDLIAIEPEDYKLPENHECDFRHMTFYRMENDTIYRFTVPYSEYHRYQQGLCLMAKAGMGFSRKYFFTNESLHNLRYQTNEQRKIMINWGNDSC